ncbi:MAG: aldehyde dehydrogenase [Actinobacteria bacterium]|nr:aldehyde dehydrogenase [Actinomycetota bacterium]
MSPVTSRSTTWRSFIQGRWQEPTTDETFDVLEPSTGSRLAKVVACTAADVDAAVSSAREAFDKEWRWRTPRERAGTLRLIANKIREQADELAELETRENGKPIRDARAFDITVAHLTFDYFASLAESMSGRILDQGPIQARITYEPYGVIAAILPFNWPPIHFANKCAAALAAGNTVVVKPGEQAPLTVLRLTELANEVLPPGVLNAVPGPAAGVALAAHPGIGRVTFTGSSETGRKVMASAAANLIPSTMELGGKNAFIVFDDADTGAAVKAALEAMYFNQGEACTSTARILVQQSVHDEVLTAFAAATQRLVVGDGLDAATDIGPMVDGRQRDRIREYVEIGKGEGARVVAEGSIPDSDALRNGFYVAPVVFADVRPEMRIAQEEIFGPVACFISFATEAEALEIANGTAYGLTAAVFTSDPRRADRLVARLEVGMVFVNNYFRGSLLGSPFGGVKASGFGRETTEDTLHEFLRSKNARFPSGERAIPCWQTAERVMS